jgi:acetyltransferase-like isoleucine patch superfamily enzyme
MTPRGYISPSAIVHHSDLRLGRHVFVDDRVVLYQRENGGKIELGDNVNILRDSILETAYGGYLVLGDDASIHPRCQLNAYLSPITIGKRTMIAPGCAFYPYDHGVLPGIRISEQPIKSKGAITVGDDAWIGFGSIILGGVRIGKGAVIGAGSVVTKDVPDGGIAIGNPARLVKMRDEIRPSVSEADTRLFK